MDIRFYKPTVADITRMQEIVKEEVVNGKILLIEGGNYRICDGSASKFCDKQDCIKKKYYSKITEIAKGDKKMKKEVVYLTKDSNSKVRVYSETIRFNSEDELKGLLSNKVFDNSTTEKFYLIFDIKE